MALQWFLACIQVAEVEPWKRRILSAISENGPQRRSESPLHRTQHMPQRLGCVMDTRDVGMLPKGILYWTCSCLNTMSSIAIAYGSRHQQKSQLRQRLK